MIAFMTWMWLSATVVLVGAAIDVEMERQAVPDTGNKIGFRTVARWGGAYEHEAKNRLEMTRMSQPIAG